MFKLKKQKLKSLTAKLVGTGLIALMTGSLLLNAGNALVGEKVSAENNNGSNESAMERVTNQIKLSAQGASGDGEKLEFSPSELKTIGFFVSNYYSPFVTQVGNASSAKDLQKVLVDSTSLNEKSAKIIADGVVGNQSNAQELKLYSSHDGGKTWKRIGSKGTSASYHDVLFGSAQIFTEDILNSDYAFSFKDRFNWKDKNSLVGLAASSEKEVPKSEIAYMFNPLKGGTPTTAQTIFYSNFKNVNEKNTFGASFMHMYSSDDEEQKKFNSYISKANTTDSFIKYFSKEDVSRQTIEQFYKRSMYSSKMLRDTFGNLIATSGSSDKAGKYVVLPASQNPMHFAINTEKGGSTSSASEDKKEDDKDKPASSDDIVSWQKSMWNAKDTGVGYTVPVNNMNTIALIDAGSLSISVSDGKATIGSEVYKSIYPYTGSHNANLDEGWGGDNGARLNDLLITQFLMDRVSYKVSDDNKKAITKHYTDLKNYDAKPLDAKIKELTYTNMSEAKSFLIFPLGQWFKGQNLKSFDATWHPATGGSATGIAYFAKFSSTSGSDDIITFSTSLSSSGTLVDQTLGFDKFGLDKTTWEGIDAVGKTTVESHIMSGNNLSFSADMNKLEDGYWKGTGKKGSLENTGLITGEGAKRYGINLFMSYLLARANPKESPFVINLEGTPEVNLSAVPSDGEETLSSDKQDAIIKNMVYYMLNPTLGREYKQRWSKTFMNSVILASMQDMVGANTSSTYGGTTRYIELTGFGTIPRLNEVKLTSYLYDNFTQWGIFVLILAFLLMLYFVFTKQMKIVPAFIAMVALGFTIYTPPKLINSMVNVTNGVSGYFYRDKFYFWALYQHQNYEDSLSQLASYGESGDSNSYNNLLLQLQGGSGKNDDVYEWQQTLGSVVKVRWMAPKKDGYVEQVKRDLGKKTNTDAGSDPTPVNKPTDSEDTQSDNKTQAQDGGSWTGGGLTNSLLNQGISNQDYTGLDTNYLYRGYTDISDYSRFYYGNIMGDNLIGSGSQNHTVGDAERAISTILPTVNEQAYGASTLVLAKDQKRDMLSYISASGGEESLRERAEKGFINDRQGAVNGDLNKKYLKRIFAPIGSNTVSGVSSTNLANIKVGDTVGLGKNYFMASIRDFNNHGAPFSEILSKLNEDYGGTTLDSEDAVSLSTFALYTESPFYYFSWNLYDQGLKTTKGSSGEFKTMMLENNDSFFYNYKIQEGTAGYGAMKDFMDFGSLFKVIIPYLREANKPLLDWSDKFGTKPYEGYGSTVQELDAIADKNSEAYYKTWHNVMSDNLYRSYSGWVDAMYDLDMAKPEEIEYGGKKQTVSEPLNPATYTVRPMIFSESEMSYYGVKDYELTKAEQAIIKTARDIRNDWLQLMNYYQLDDAVLNTAASMIVTFNFNKNFSQTNFMQEQIVLEPQGFELKTFGWDGYLRLILQNATGESIQYNKELKSDIYEIVAEKDGTMTLIMMWLQSFIVVYVLPTILILVMIVLPISMILSVLASFIRRDNRAVKVFTRDCLSPFIYVLLTNIGLSFTVSKLMGDAGTTLVTGDLTGTANFTSPRTVIGILMFVTAIATAIYFLSVRALIKGLWKNGVVLTVPVKAAVEGMGSFTLSALTGRMNQVFNSTNGTSSFGGSSRGANSSDGFGGGSSASGKSSSDLSEENLNTPKSRRKRGFGKHQEVDNTRSQEAQRRVNDVLNKEDDNLGIPKQNSKRFGKDNSKPSTFSDLLKQDRAKDTERKVNDIFNKE